MDDDRGGGDGAPLRHVPPERDATLLRRVAAGDRDAHRALYERHALSVQRYLVARLGGDVGLAEEVLHDVMIEVTRAAAGFRGASTVKTWLFGIAHHRAANTLRARARETVLPLEESGSLRQPDVRGLGHGRVWGSSRDRGADRGDAAAVDAAIDLEAALAALPDAQRAALELVLLHGLSVEETAVVLGVAPGTVKSRVFRAKDSMRKHLAREVGP